MKVQWGAFQALPGGMQCDEAGRLGFATFFQLPASSMTLFDAAKLLPGDFTDGLYSLHGPAHALI